MTVQPLPVRKIFSRFFPRKYSSVSAKTTQDFSTLNAEEKKELAFNAIARGETELLQGKLTALPLFETASTLQPHNPEIWYRQGISFFEYGSEEGKEKALLLANKYFKKAIQMRPTYFEAWVAWGNTLLQLGKCHEEYHFHLDAKEKYQQALACSERQSQDILADLYWDYGSNWMEIATHSGEASDIQYAMDAFQASLRLQKVPSPEFFHDYGSAYLEMGLLINDTKLYLQAVHYLCKATQLSAQYFDGWNTLAEVYSQLYINTLNQTYLEKASQSFVQATKLEPTDAETYLNWAQILCEGGRHQKDAKKLRQSVEHCARAHILDAENLLITAQWVESLSWLGATTSRLDLLIEAEHKILKATDLFPEDADLWHAYGICMICFGIYYEEADYFEMAIEKLQYGLSIDRTSAEHWHSLALVHKLYADMTHHEDLLERANRFFAKAIDLKPSCPALLYDAAVSSLSFTEMMHDLPSLNRALKYLEELLQANKEVLLQHPSWLFEYGKAVEWLAEFSMEELHLTQALDIFSQILLIEPDFQGIYRHIAGCNMAMGHSTGEIEYYKKALLFFRLAAKQEEDHDQLFLDWGLTLMELAHHSLDTHSMHQLYLEAEQKISHAGLLGNTSAYYHLACLHSILGRTNEAMQFIYKSISAQALPPIEELYEDEWLDNLRNTTLFTNFIHEIELKLQMREQ